ncbi:capsid cement protein [Nonomuraea bangladeshensis]|uniref:Capsid cement protein n=1 Tax=Nonomuraea bangladeshensis TaxID=404385 RepID=A0ABV3H497_9ACTN
MADYTPLQTVNQLPWTSTASASIVGGQLVEVTGSGSVGPAAADSQRVVGVAAHDAANGARVTVHPLAGVVHELVAGTGGVTAGQAVKVGTSADEVLPLSGSAQRVGSALTTASGGAMVQVLGGTAAAGAAPATTLSASASLNFPSVAAAGQQELTVTVTGAAVGDAVVLAPPAAVDAGLVWAGRVSAANTVTVRVANITDAPIDPAAAAWGVQVIKAP